MELSEVGYNFKVTCLYRDWNCLEYGKIATLHVCTENGTVYTTVTLQSYMFYTGTGTVSSTVILQSYMFVQRLELSTIR